MISCSDRKLKCSPDIASFHYKRAFRIVEECLDVAFSICNTDLSHYTSSKLFDIFDQILPTAFVLNTGYWVYFVASQGCCLCVCARYGVPCRHIRNIHHWLDLQPITDPNGEVIFFPKIYGPVSLAAYKVTLEGITDPMGYNVSINMSLAHRKIDSKKFHLNIMASYIYTDQLYQAHSAVMFNPAPYHLDIYGCYLTSLKQHKQSQEDKLCHIVTINDMPQSSLMLVNVNSSRYVHPSRISALLLVKWKPVSQVKKHFNDQETQTDTKPENAGFSSGPSPSQDDLLWSVDGKRDSQSFPILTNCLKKSPFDFQSNLEQDFENSEEYDVQFPNFVVNKIIRRERNGARIQPSPLQFCSQGFYENTIKLEHQYAQSPTSDAYQRGYQSFITESSKPAKRKRGRPKLHRNDDIQPYDSRSRKYKREVSQPSPASSSRSVESPREFQYTPTFSEVLRNIRGPNSNYLYNDPAYAVLENVFRESAKRPPLTTRQEIDFELDIIDEYVKEQIEKENSQPTNYKLWRDLCN